MKIEEAKAKIEELDKTVKAQTAEIKTLTEKNADLEELKDGHVKEIAGLNKKQEELLNSAAVQFEMEKQMETLSAKLKERDDKLEKQTVEIEKLTAQIDGRKYVDLTDQVPFLAKWKSPQGKAMSRKVQFKNPKVRLPDGLASVVSSVALSKVAAGQEPSEIELKESPALEKMKPEDATALITKWAKMDAGILVDVD